MEKADRRCFGTGKEFYAEYHDREWGVPVHDDRYLLEMLCLEGAQAGLSWETILKRREGYRRLFHHFEPAIVAKMTDNELEELLKDPAIINPTCSLSSFIRELRQGICDASLVAKVSHLGFLTKLASSVSRYRA
ncbi:MAG: hypothetical protein Tsb0015_05330 [Simkaniaceae bacterium]